jgi:hypothetical protein
MNYIELIKRFWQLHELHQFSVTETALYFHLIEICNRCSWTNPFKRNNARICADLGVSINTLKNARNHLSQSGLIQFEGKQGSANIIYKLQTSSNFDEVSSEVSIEVSNEVVTKLDTKLDTTKDKLNKTKLNNTPLPPKSKTGEKCDDEKKEKYADFVSMTNAEYQALVAKVGESGTKRCVEILDNYKGANGKRYKSDYRAILNWVLDRYQDEATKKSQKVAKEKSERNYDEQF